MLVFADAIVARATSKRVSGSVASLVGGRRGVLAVEPRHGTARPRSGEASRVGQLVAVFRLAYSVVMKRRVPFGKERSGSTSPSRTPNPDMAGVGGTWKTTTYWLIDE